MNRMGGEEWGYIAAVGQVSLTGLQSSFIPKDQDQSSTLQTPTGQKAQHKKFNLSHKIKNVALDPKINTHGYTF
jgi:hypothetical protein